MKSDSLHVKMLWPVIAMVLLWNGVTRADEIFFDDFSDGSVTNDVPVAADGTPVRWEAVPNTVADASSGDLVLAADMAVGVPGVGVTAEQFTLADTSIRTQVSRNGDDIESTGVFVRRTSVGSYAGGIGNAGGIWIVREPGTTFLALTPTAFDPEEELVLQLDAIGNKLQLWAWTPGSTMPLGPQLTAIDDTYTEGDVGLFAVFEDEGNQGSTGTGVFRYAQLADMQIPEPAASILCGLGLMCFAVVRNGVTQALSRDRVLHGE